MWTLLAARRAAAAARSTSAGDFFSRPLVGGPAAVVVPPHALAAPVTIAAIAAAAVSAKARRMWFMVFFLSSWPALAGADDGFAGGWPDGRLARVSRPAWPFRPCGPPPVGVHQGFLRSFVAAAGMPDAVR